MIKKFHTYIKEKVEDLDPYGEEIWDDNDIKRNFFNFLNNMGSFDRYMANFNDPKQTEWRIKKGYESDLDVFINDQNNSKEEFIWHGFKWDSTPEGMSFWNLLDSKWGNYLARGN